MMDLATLDVSWILPSSSIWKLIEIVRVYLLGRNTQKVL